MKERNLIPDFLKGMAIFFMILVHIVELFATTEVYNSIFGRIALFLGAVPAAPLFLAIMGYFLSVNKKPFFKKLKRGFQLVFWGFLLNLGLNSNLLLHIYSGKFQIDATPYFFGVDILFLAGISILILAILEKLPRMKNFLIFAIMVISPIIHFYLPNSENEIIQYLNAYFWGNYWWSYFPVFPWISYVFAGYLFNEFSLSNLGNKTPNSIYLILALFLFNLPYGITVSVNLSEYYHHGIWFFLWALEFLLLMIFLTHKFSNFISSQKISFKIASFGKNVT